MSKLAAATWKTQDREHVSIEATLAAMSLDAGETAFVQLCIDCGFLSRDDAGALRFRDSWQHGYLAARGLVRFLGRDFVDEGLTRDRAVSILVQIGSPAIPVMIAALAVQDDSMGLGASVVLKEIGPPAIPALKEAMSFGNQRVRRWVTSALTSKENANLALPLLIRAVQEDDQPLVVVGAVTALGESENPEAEPALIAALKHPHPMVQPLSKAALAKFKSRRAQRALDDLARPSPGGASNAETKSGALQTVSSPPRIFISYANEDVSYADELRRLLKLADFDPWMDSTGLLAGDAWETRLVEAIRTADFVVALISENTAGGYQERELRVAVENAPGDRQADVPFILPCAIGKLLHGDTAKAIPDFLDPDQLILIWNFTADWIQVHKALYTSARSAGLYVPALLRSKPLTDFDDAVANQMIVEKNFFDSSRNRDGRPAATNLKTQFNGALVEDRATGRLWTRSCGGPLPYIGKEDAGVIVRNANDDRLGGENDWRLPTLEEAMSLMTPEKNANGLFISHLFSDDGYVLTCDTQIVAREIHVWVAGYAIGECQTVPAKDSAATVRLVRTDWEYLT